MAEIKLNELTPQPIAETDNLIGYTEEKEVVIVVPDFVSSNTLENYILKTGNTSEDPITGDIYFNQNIILKYNQPDPVEILGEDSEGIQFNIISLRTYDIDGEPFDQTEIGSSRTQWNGNSNAIPTFDMPSNYDYDSGYSVDLPGAKQQVVFKSWLTNNFRHNAPIQNVDLSLSPSSVTVNYGIFTVLFQRLSATELAVSIGTIETTPPTVYYLLQYFGPDLAHTEQGEANFVNGFAVIGTYNSTVSKIVSEFNYNNSLYRATFNRYKENYSLCSAYIERIG